MRTAGRVVALPTAPPGAAQGPPGSSRVDLASLSDLLTIDEARAVLRVGRNLAYRLVRQRGLGIRLGRKVMVPKRAIERLLEGSG